MIARALIHVGGMPGAGKKTFIERLLGADVAMANCVRAERDIKLRSEVESQDHADLRRYRAARGSADAHYRFAYPDAPRFFASHVMTDYSEAVFIEGDGPLDDVDASVFIASKPPRGRLSLWFATRPVGPVGPGRLALPPLYEGLATANLLIVNLKSLSQRPAAASFLDQVVHLRKDKSQMRDLLSPFRRAVPLTAVIADLSNAKDAGTRRAVARIRRSVERRLA